MRKPALMPVLTVLLSVSGCGAGWLLPAIAPNPPAGTSDRVGPYVAVIRYLTAAEPSHHLYIDTSVCSPKRTAPSCADLSAQEQAGMVNALAAQGIMAQILNPVRAAAVDRRVFKGEASLITFGVTTPRGNNLAIYAWIGCGSLCGTGSTWLATRDVPGWVVHGPVPGAGVAIS